MTKKNGRAVSPARTTAKPAKALVPAEAKGLPALPAAGSGGVVLQEGGTTLVAGLVGTEVSSSGDKLLSETGERDTVRPVVGWWWFPKKSDDSVQSESSGTLDSDFDDF